MQKGGPADLDLNSSKVRLSGLNIEKCCWLVCQDRICTLPHVTLWVEEPLRLAAYVPSAYECFIGCV